MLDSSVRKKDQSRYILRSSSMPGAPRCARKASTAVPKPNHPGSMMRDSDQLKTHGIARRSSIRSEVFREPGRLPTWRSAISLIGVAVRKKLTNPGVS